MRLPFEKVVKYLKALRGGALRIFLNLLGHRGDSPTDLSAGECLLLWLADRMELDRIVPVHHRDLILNELLDDITGFGNLLGSKIEDNAAPNELPVSLISIANKAFATISGRDGFLNLHMGGWVKGIRSYPELQVVYNLTGIFTLGVHSLRHARPDAEARQARMQPSG